MHDTPGVTRDRREADASLGDLSFKIIDTAGIEEAEKGSLTARMAEQTMKAVADADVCLFLIDAREGVTAADEIVAEAVRRAGKPIVLAANKCEGRQTHAGMTEAWRLGLGDPIAISAEHRKGLEELAEALLPYVVDEASPRNGRRSQQTAAPCHYRPAQCRQIQPLQCAARRAERSLTGPEAGITRDAIAVRWQAQGREILLHDTAGLRRKARAAGHTLEEMSVASTLDAIRFADCVIVVIDATMAFEKQDLTIADLIAQEGRAIVFAVNKWDLVEKKAGGIESCATKSISCCRKSPGRR